MSTVLMGHTNYYVYDSDVKMVKKMDGQGVTVYIGNYLETYKPYVAQTPTATVTSTRTSTVTRTPTKTGTATQTPTMTEVKSRTSTRTFTNTPTVTSTRTRTPKPTATATNKKTNTLTITSTNGPTRTLTFTKSYTPTKTATGPTPTFTQTPTITLTPTITNTPTVTATRTRANTPSKTYTRVPTNSPTRTVTLTGTPTRTVTKTFTPSKTLTYTKTLTKTLTPTNTFTVTLTPTVTNTLTSTVTVTSTLTVTSTITPTVTPTALVPTGETWLYYYYSGTTRIAMRQSSEYGDNVMFLLTDHLGSSSIVTDAQGAKIGEVRYKAWGETRYDSGNVPTKQRYTGQRDETELGLIYYGARWYDPSIGRFNQADTIIPQAGNPLAWDRFAYTLNNPVRYNDPSGHDVGCHGTEASNCKAQTTIGANNIIPPPSRQQAPIAQYNEPELQQTPQPPKQTTIGTPYPAQISQPVQTAPVGTPPFPEPLSPEDVADILNAASDALDIADYQQWIKIPGVVGIAMDINSQNIRDSDKGYSRAHKNARSGIVAVEGQGISYLSVGMGGLLGPDQEA